MTWLISNLFALGFALAFIAAIRWSASLSWTAACMIYLLSWTVLYDGRFLRAELPIFQEPPE